MHSFKICVFGDYNTGKTSFINRLHKQKYVEEYNPTIGIDYMSKIIDSGNGYKIKTTFWDCAGQERFNSIIDGFFRNITAGILFFDVSNRKSYTNVLDWIKMFRQYNDENIPILLVGNKIDKENRCISKHDAYILANDFNLLYIEMSIKNNININNAIDLLIYNICKNKDKNPNIKTIDEDDLILDNPSKYSCDYCIIS
jgi:small GTP-binding protein